jgi:hypothetical protein
MRRGTCEKRSLGSVAAMAASDEDEDAAVEEGVSLPSAAEGADVADAEDAVVETFVKFAVLAAAGVAVVDADADAGEAEPEI